MKEIIAKNVNPVEFYKDKKISPLTEIFLQINFLKAIYQKGYLLDSRGVNKEKCESVAEHSFELAIFVLLINDQFKLDLDVSKLLITALMHDFGEIKDGDLIPSEDPDPDQKALREKANVAKLFKNIKGGKKYIKIFNEFVDRETEEAELVVLCDVLQRGMQARIYNLLYGMPDADFRKQTESLVAGTKLAQLFKEIIR